MRSPTLTIFAIFAATVGIYAIIWSFFYHPIRHHNSSSAVLAGGGGGGIKEDLQIKQLPYKKNVSITLNSDITVTDVKADAPGLVTTGKLFYIYDWPVDIINRWPKKYDHKRLSISPEFYENYGIGKIEDADAGLYHTHQYSLFRTFYYRLLESPQRTLNPDEASLFFVPFDLGMDSTTRASDGALCRTDCPTMRTVYNLLNSSKYFVKHRGKDHFILHTINQLMLHFTHETCLELYDLCFECSKLSIDAYEPDVYNQLKIFPHLHHKWWSIPFPSNYHWSPGATKAPWILMREPAQRKIKRPFAICYMGSDQITAKLQRNLRIELKNECAKRPSSCLLIDLKTHDSQTHVFHDINKQDPSLFNSSSNSNSNKYTDSPSSSKMFDRPSSSSASDVRSNPYLHATFCFMPGGDFPTRKGFLDAMLSGCIPITFQLFAAITQWKFHWKSLRNAHDASLFMQRDLAMRNISYLFDTLETLSKDETLVQTKRRKIAEIGSRFQYNRPNPNPKSDLNRLSGQKGPVKVEEDAVSVILHALLE